MKWSLYVEQHAVSSAFTTSSSWLILSPIEASIRRKIEEVGTPLKDWDISIKRGILTGCNEAFIISTAKRDEILANCQSEEERQRTADLIRPILRGKDIKRYGYDWAELWLIATFPTRHYDIEQYPAVKQYLLSFGMERLEQTGKSYVINGEVVKARKKTTNQWFETQDNIGYWEDFDKPKIIFQEIVQESQFFFDSNGEFLCNDTCRIITGEKLNYLLLILNSSLFFYAVKHFYGGGGLGKDGVRMKHTFFQDFPSLPYDEDLDLLIGSNDIDRIDRAIFKSYQLSKDEIQAVLKDESE